MYFKICVEFCILDRVEISISKGLKGGPYLVSKKNQQAGQCEWTEQRKE